MEINDQSPLTKRGQLFSGRNSSAHSKQKQEPSAFSSSGRMQLNLS
jgi:hypothetical protein